MFNFTTFLLKRFPILIVLEFVTKIYFYVIHLFTLKMFVFHICFKINDKITIMKCCNLHKNVACYKCVLYLFIVLYKSCINVLRDVINLTSYYP